jgi:hypothetical protein
MNEKIIEALVLETIEWLDYLDVHGYNEATEEDIIMAIDQPNTRAIYNQVMDLQHREYLVVIEKVLQQLTVRWKKEFDHDTD